MTDHTAFNDLIEQFIAPYSPRGRQNKAYYLQAWARWATKKGIDPTAPTRTDLDHYRGSLLDRGGMPRAINSHLSVLRSFCRWMVEENHSTTDAARFLQLVPHPHQVTIPWLTDDETAIFLDHVDHHGDPLMRGLIYVLTYHGSRPQETRLIDEKDIDLTAGTISFRHRKTGRNDRHTMPSAVSDALRPLLTGDTALFINTNTGRRTTKSVVQQRFNDLVSGAGIPKITQYGLRASFITNALTAGVPLESVMYAAGHVSPAQTLKYDQAREIRASIAQIDAARRIAEIRTAS